MLLFALISWEGKISTFN